MNGPYTEDGGMQVAGPLSFPIHRLTMPPAGCSACKGNCPSPSACELPIDPPPASSIRGWAWFAAFAIASIAAAWLGSLPN